jgi:hypothetical protein
MRRGAAAKSQRAKDADDDRHSRIHCPSPQLTDMDWED